MIIVSPFKLKYSILFYSVLFHSILFNSSLLWREVCRIDMVMALELAMADGQKTYPGFIRWCSQARNLELFAWKFR